MHWLKDGVGSSSFGASVFLSVKWGSFSHCFIQQLLTKHVPCGRIVLRMGMQQWSRQAKSLLSRSDYASRGDLHDTSCGIKSSAGNKVS